MSSFKHRLWIVVTFGVLTALAVAVSRAYLPDDSAWAAALPWGFLVLFWIYLLVMSRWGRRRGGGTD